MKFGLGLNRFWVELVEPFRVALLVACRCVFFFLAKAPVVLLEYAVDLLKVWLAVLKGYVSGRDFPVLLTCP